MEEEGSRCVTPSSQTSGDETCRPPDMRPYGSSVSKVEDDDQAEVVPGAVGGDSSDPFSAKEKAVHAVQRCPKCSKHLHDLLLCKECGTQFHKAVQTRPRLSSGRALRIYPVSQLGQELESQFELEEEAPPVVVKCLENLEQRGTVQGLDLYDVYKVSASSDEIEELRRALDKEEGVTGVSLDSFSPYCVASFLKRYLRELPNPTIPTQFYYAFMQAVEAPEKRTATLATLVAELPPHHGRLLRYIMQHVCRICSHQAMLGHWQQPSVLAHVFCHILLRPPWDSITELVDNTERHIRVFEGLLLRLDWGHQLPDFSCGEGGEAALSPVEELGHCPWYWGDLGRDEASDKLAAQPDGSFLVRNSSSPGCFTLTLKEGGTVKLIKIHHRFGKYGFVIPCHFRSVPELVEYYRHHSLREYNRQLDVCLEYPVCCQEGGAGLEGEELWEKLHEANLQLQQHLQEYETLLESQRELTHELGVKQQAIEACTETERILQQQLDLHERHRNTSGLDLPAPGYRDNSEAVRARLGEIGACRKQQEESLHLQVATLKSLGAKIGHIRPQVKSLLSLREHCRKALISEGAEAEQVDRCIQDRVLPDTSLRRCPHTDQTTWFMAQCSRQQAEAILAGKPDGTFLVRPSSRGGQFALSIMAGGGIGHCVIHKTSQGLGFTVPYCTFETLQQLVLHYRTTSLADHNEQLDVTLLTPVHAADAAQDSCDTL